MARKLQTTLSTIKAILIDANEKQEESRAVKDWIRRLKEVVYDADDLLDDVATEGLRRKVEGQGRAVRKVCDFFSSSNQIAFRFKMSHRIKDVRERLDEVAKEMSDFGFIISKEVGVDMRIKNSSRETDSCVLKSEIIGRDKDKEEIIKSLMCPVNQSNISVAAIVGFGGLGKTALAQLVFNDEKVVNYFDLKLWCFAYCAMFPKDYEFGKEDLIQLWMAQGYIQSRSQSKDESLEEIGEGYFNELLFRSFFQKENNFYKMHDLINDLAQSMAGDSCFVLDDNTKYVPNRIQHVFSGNLSFEECFKQLKNRGLRTLYCEYYGDKLRLNLGSIFSISR
ncbi:putative disease resistance protein RGA4 [Manihot esculenta]|uniref:putative disease resistance protein RGA4 n=1 Tax=Manihot esculenta TaxID=3983 RepID=UPI001CC636B3|nr:putative disease resistance protein RGA4 [Manihot esculenta]